VNVREFADGGWQTESMRFHSRYLLCQIRAICIQARTSIRDQGPLPAEEAVERIIDLVFSETGGKVPVLQPKPAQEFAEREAAAEMVEALPGERRKTMHSDPYMHVHLARVRTS
jgi:hypothetical protein